MPIPPSFASFSILLFSFQPLSACVDCGVSDTDSNEQFLYPYDMDNMYVITSSQEEAASLFTILAKPWQVHSCVYVL
jgi:hypothetical protein